MSGSYEQKVHTVSIVIPIYRGEKTLEPLVEEIFRISTEPELARRKTFSIAEVILVYDNGPDCSDIVIRRLLSREGVRALWLSRNFGQHAATLAGIASSSGDWIVTMDEDGQQDPRDIALMLDTALRNGAQVVYAKPTNKPPHGPARNTASKFAKIMVTNLVGGPHVTDFNSFRLILGSVGRTVAAYAGSGVYLDVALSWVAGRYATAPVKLREEGRGSGYSSWRLFAHFWRLVLTSGTRGLRLVSILGITFALLGVAITLWIVFVKIIYGIDVQGFATLVIAILITSGATLFSLGIVAEYIGISVNMAMGKPAYVITGDLQDGPLGAPLSSHAADERS